VKKSKFNIRALRAQADKINGIICSRNLFVCLPGEKRRVINCEVMSEGLTVEDLYSGNTYDVATNKFEDGYSREVLL
jgi:hypothetical protein